MFLYSPRLWLQASANKRKRPFPGEYLTQAGEPESSLMSLNTTSALWPCRPGLRSFMPSLHWLLQSSKPVKNILWHGALIRMSPSPPCYLRSRLTWPQKVQGEMWDKTEGVEVWEDYPPLWSQTHRIHLQRCPGDCFCFKTSPEGRFNLPASRDAY